MNSAGETAREVVSRSVAPAMLAALAIALGLAGCGGSSSNATSQPTPKPATIDSAQSRSMIAQANSICQQLTTKFAAEKTQSVSVAEILRIGPRRTVEETQTARELAELTPPPALTHDWQLILRYRRALAQELTALVDAARTNDQAAIVRLSASKIQNHRKLAVLADRNRLTQCART
jgi:hypothetical protein